MDGISPPPLLPALLFDCCYGVCSKCNAQELDRLYVSSLYPKEHISTREGHSDRAAIHLHCGYCFVPKVTHIYRVH